MLCLANRQFNSDQETKHERFEHGPLPLFQLQPELQLRLPRERPDTGGCSALASLGVQMRRRLPLQSMPLHALQMLS
jgi:hypothetical protein